MELPPEAARQGGRFSYQQARAFGLTGHRLTRLLADGVLVRSGHGVYAASGVTATRDLVLAHTVLVHDAQLASTERWYAARRSCALLLGLPLIGRPPSRVQLVRDGSQQGAHGRDRHLRVSPLPSADRWEHKGIAMCTPARTVVDIARAESFRNGVVVADAALRRGVDPADLHAVLARMRRWPGVARARAVVRFADGRAESPGESLVRVACLAEQLLVPEPQVEVWSWGRFVGRVDLMIGPSLLAIESDGAIKFNGPLVLPALISRQEELRDAGIDVLRTHWDETFKDTDAFGRRLRQRIRDRGTPALPPGLELRSTVVHPQAPLLGVPDDLAA
jgi:hypothetical protein